jgi:Fe2+ transport system protein B
MSKLSTLFKRNLSYKFGNNKPSSNPSVLKIPTYEYINTKIDSKFDAIKDLILNSEKRSEERMNVFEKRIDDRMNNFEKRVDDRMNHFEKRSEERMDYFRQEVKKDINHLEQKIEFKFENMEQKINGKMVNKAIATGTFFFIVFQGTIAILQANDVFWV